MKLALKRLTRSDLTFFRWQYENFAAGNQKAINLNRDVFQDQLFPAISAAMGDSSDVRIGLSIFGPSGLPELNLQRKIIKGETYKNWRLDGELVNNPPEEPNRFDSLKEGDLVVLGFVGELKPATVKAVFLSADSLTDQSLVRSLSPLVAARSMIGLEPKQLESFVGNSGVGDAHPIHSLLVDDELAEAAIGYAPSVRNLQRRGVGRISKEMVARARAAASRTGDLGEDLVFSHFTTLQATGTVLSVEWVSQEFALSTYDFRIDAGKDSERILDVKATRGDFGRPIHMSLSELLEAAARENYDLYRVYELTEASGKLRVAHAISGVAREILAALSSLPQYATVDSIALDPEAFKFGKEIVIEQPAEELPEAG